MIFATVGTQLPFPRLIDALEAQAAALGEEIIAQIGSAPEGAPGTWPTLDIRATLSPAEFETIFTTARVIVAHAGIGTILSAKRWRKPLIILPRRHALGEHRNDHQLATAAQVESLPGIHVAWEVGDLGALLAEPDLEPASDAASPSLERLTAHLRQIIGTGAPQAS